MTSLQSSVVGTWLLDRFCGEPAIAGDLLQEYRKGRSTRWYWKEVLSAVFVYSASTVWEHKWLTLRAIATGWLFSTIVIKGGMRDFVHPWWDGVAPPALYPCIAYVPWLLNGWLISRLHRPYSTAMVSAYAVWLIVRSIAPVYSAAADAMAGVQGSAFVWEFSSRLSTVFVMLCGGTLCAYREQVLAARRAVSAGAVGRMSVARG
jgi:hypothetical protein